MTIGQKLVRLTIVLALSLALSIPAADRAAAQGRSGPPPEPVDLITKDGVQLKGTYFPSAARRGSAQAKQATPVVLLHDHKSTHAIFNSLIAALQPPVDENANRPYFAVITVDLRAHGGSTKRLAPDGTVFDLDAARLAKEDFLAMAQFDMEAIRSFLVDKNDAGELNLNKLSLVGSGMGASVAANWALKDWTMPPLAVGKQGQDVKAIVLISPRWSFDGLSMQDPMKFTPLKKNVAWLVLGGMQDPKAKPDFDRIIKQLERHHPVNEKNAAVPGPPVRDGFYVNLLPTNLQGDQLIKRSGAAIDEQVVRFLLQDVGRHQLPWTNRRNKLP
jgi:pimeloyl-ACP methyl ester carboxylesterase